MELRRGRPDVRAKASPTVLYHRRTSVMLRTRTCVSREPCLACAQDGLEESHLFDLGLHLPLQVG